MADKSYDQSHFPDLFAAEDRHFWFQTRNKVISTLAQQLMADYPAGYRFLEIGCGNGNVLKELERVATNGTVIGIDLFAEGLRFARLRVSAPLVQADIFNTPFKVAFEMVGMFDVLEHLQNDVDVLAQVRTMLAPGGALMLTVPAFKSLWSYADRNANHKRRYERADLEQKLTQAGFQVDFVSYYMMSVFPLVWVGRKLANRALRLSDNPHELERSMFRNELKIRPGMNQIMYQAVAQEIPFLARRRNLPFGTSLIAIARRI
ncbi:MAG: class I SAM-dependent methyltransferase [Chloroflexota bacterium]